MRIHCGWSRSRSNLCRSNLRAIKPRQQLSFIRRIPRGAAIHLYAADQLSIYGQQAKAGSLPRWDDDVRPARRGESLGSTDVVDDPVFSGGTIVDDRRGGGPGQRVSVGPFLQLVYGYLDDEVVQR